MRPLSFTSSLDQTIPIHDRLDRPLKTLRLSVTDRCNLRCRYCMPDETYEWIASRETLTFEELTTLATAFVRTGVDRIRLTGGEPLLRRNLDSLVNMLRQANPFCEICLTTNGALLDRYAHALAQAGLDRVTISLDSLDRKTFQRMTSRDLLPRVIAGIEAARQAQFQQIKLNCVVVRGVNDEELPRLVLYARDIGAEVRFIEYMELAGTRYWTPQSFVSKQEILQSIESALGPVNATRPDRFGTAERYRCRDGTTFGIIAPMSAPFCETCVRARLSADGQFYMCLHAQQGFDLRSCVRAGLNCEQLAARITRLWADRTDRGSQERLSPTCAPNHITHIRMNARGG